MKQHITVEQIKELSNEDYNKLNKYRKEHLFIHHGERVEDALARYFNIGKMIEILHKKDGTRFDFLEYMSGIEEFEVKIAVFIEDKGWAGKYFSDKELCDALWEAVKEVL